MIMDISDISKLLAINMNGEEKSLKPIRSITPLVTSFLQAS